MRLFMRIVMAPVGLLVIGLVGVGGIAALGAIGIAIRLWDRTAN